MPCQTRDAEKKVSANM